MPTALNPQHGLQDVALLLACSSLVMVMQAGFCCIESGLVRSKNSINVALKNVVDFCIAGLVFWLVGYAVMFGTSHRGIIGTTYFLYGDDANAWQLSFFLFQLVFCGTATTIISGAVAERMRFAGYVLVAVLVSGLIYPIFGHWAWGGVDGSGPSGWLRELGFIDFAGATVVHSVGGWVALAAVIVVGPRLGRFGKDRQQFHGHNLPMSSLGVLLLWFGWFGFNGGSTYAVSEEIPAILVKTTLAGAAGGVTAMLLSWAVVRQPRVEFVLNGVIAGLVGITAGCHVIPTASSVVVGAVAAAICCAATWVLEKQKIDDVIGAVPAHACAGVWGTLAVALMGDPSLWDNGNGRLDQLAVQAIGVVVCFAWSFGVGYTVLKLINAVQPIRINSKDEEVGLNVSEHGAHNPVTDLVDEMTRHREKGEFSTPVKIDAHTDVAAIAQEYNKVLDRVNTEIKSREEISEALWITNKDLQLLQEVATAANEATSVDKAFTVILEAVCEHTNWPVGHVYMCDKFVPDRLMPTNLWYLERPEEFKTFRRVTSKTDFLAGVGLPGRVLESGKPAWIIDVTKDLNFTRAKLAKDIGVKAGFAFPVLIGPEVVAVLEFFSSKAIQPNERLLEVMANVGTQLGRIIERKRSEDTLRQLAENDLLTDLANRESFNTQLNQAIECTKKDNSCLFAVLFLDLDRFKVVNDSLGHEVGDRLLVSIANRIRDVLAELEATGDLNMRCIAGRLGGDEFVILLQGIQPDEPEITAKKLQKTLAKPHQVAGYEVNMTVSIGIVTSKNIYQDPKEVLRDADLAMYHAKANGKAQHAIFTKEMHESLVERLNLEIDLRHALDAKQFRLQYQPIVCLESGQLEGFEALLRWHHPQRGMVPPDRFIPIAEETGLIVPIGTWVLETAVDQLKQWHEKHPNQSRLSMNINLSKNQLVQPDLIGQIKDILEESSVKAGTVKLEITESMIMDNTETMTPVLHQLRELGTKLAMDDFGTGHSSLSNLYQFPIDVLKIDRAFISAMDENRGYAAIVHAIVTLAHNLNMVVVAEGIETREQIAQLQALDCDRGQGYVFAKPLDAEDAEHLIQGEKPMSRSA